MTLISAWLPEAHFIFARAARVGLKIDQILRPASGARPLFSAIVERAQPAVDALHGADGMLGVFVECAICVKAIWFGP